MNKNVARAAVLVLLLLMAILQTSFLPHFAILGKGRFEWINLITLSVFVIALFEKRRRRFSWFAAVWGGFLLDIYSQRFFGFWIITFLTIILMIKFLIKKYVRIPSFW